MSKHITIPFSYLGFYRAATWLEDYTKYRLPKYIRNLIDFMCKEGENWAINELERIDTGNTLTTIYGYRQGDKGVIVANGAAIWIEFGTGVAHNGEGYNYPGKVPEGIVPHGTFGKHHGSNKDGWFYPDPEGEFEFGGETYSWTLGIPSNPFMYRTAEMLKRECGNIAKEVFK